MKRITVPTEVKSAQVDMFTEWLDQHSVMWTKSGQCINLFAVPDELEDGFSFFLGAVLGGAELEEVATITPERVGSVCDSVCANTTGAWDNLTWYQYRDRVRADTLHLPRLAGVLDTVLAFGKKGEGKDAVYNWAMHRVDAQETKTRYRGSNGRTELYEVKYNHSTGKWEYEVIISLPDAEKAPDLVKFGRTVTPEEYWHNRNMQALEIDWTSPKNIFMLTTALRMVEEEEGK
jgi:hypothetical protein